jgi:hypothetical protein
MSAETKDIDLEPIRHIIEYGIAGPDSPRSRLFNWKLVATNLARSIRTYVRRDPALADALALAVAEDSSAAVSRLAPLDPGFHLTECHFRMARHPTLLLQLTRIQSQGKQAVAAEASSNSMARIA